MDSTEEKFRGDMVKAIKAIVDGDNYEQYSDRQRRHHKRRIEIGSWVLLTHGVCHEDMVRGNGGAIGIR